MKIDKKIILIVLVTFFSNCIAQNNEFNGNSNESNGFIIKAKKGAKIVALFKDCKNTIWIENNKFSSWNDIKFICEGGKVTIDDGNNNDSSSLTWADSYSETLDA